MAHLKYQTQQHRVYDLETHAGESVLNAFQRRGITIPFSCRSGVCHVCLQKCTDGEIPGAAQKGLGAELCAQGYFMPCMCIPTSDMKIAAPDGLFQRTQVHHKQMLSPYVWRILLEPPADFSYKAGQFINVRRADGITRAYSLASLPSEDYFLEIHVQRKDSGTMSNWIIDALNIGDTIEIQQAQGTSYYQAESPGQAMLLIATGTGLAPLCGIVRDALHQGHQSEIHLYHGGRDAERFYLRNRLRVLEQLHDNFHYHECVSSNPLIPFYCEAGRADDAAFSRHLHLENWQVYLAGLAEMVDKASATATKNGAKPGNIYSSAFGLRDLRREKHTTHHARESGNIEVPEGFEEIILDADARCNSCAREVAAEERVIYHLSLGKVYCADCRTHRSDNDDAN